MQPYKQQRRIAPHEFDALRPLLDISERRYQVARARAVDGLSLGTVAATYGCSRAAVTDAVNTVWRTLDRYRESQKIFNESILPAGWGRAVVMGPVETIQNLIVQLQATGVDCGHLSAHAPSLTHHHFQLPLHSPSSTKTFAVGTSHDN